MHSNQYVVDRVVFESDNTEYGIPVPLIKMPKTSRTDRRVGRRPPSITQRRADRSMDTGLHYSFMDTEDKIHCPTRQIQ
jgi:hypothetical protein